MIQTLHGSCMLQGLAVLSVSGNPSLHLCAFSADNALKNVPSTLTYQRCSNPLWKSWKDPTLSREFPWQERCSSGLKSENYSKCRNDKKEILFKLIFIEILNNISIFRL